MIYIEVLNITWKLGKKLGLKKYQDFEKWVAIEFVKEIKKAIDSQIYVNKWPPLNKGYLRKKIREGLSTGMWVATEELRDALKVKKTSSRLIIGYDGRYRHNSSRVKYLDIAKTLEFGSVSQNIPPRPLFREVYYFLKKRPKTLYKLYQRESRKKGVK